MAVKGVTEHTPNRQVFGPGVWIRNYDKTLSVNAQKINIMGATTGGTTARIMQTFEADRPDGARGDVKGMVHLVEDWAEAETTMKEIDLDTLLDMLPGAETSTSGDVTTITRTRDIEDADYLTNIGFVAEHAVSGVSGFIIKNPLANDNLEMTIPEKTTASEIALKFKGHYDAGSCDTAPWEWTYPSDQVVS